MAFYFFSFFFVAVLVVAIVLVAVLPGDKLNCASEIHSLLVPTSTSHQTLPPPSVRAAHPDESRPHLAHV
jgi:hypothetical protein